MIIEKKYVKYKIFDRDGFHVHAKISKDGITICNVVAPNHPHEFQFIKSKPEIVAKYAKAMQMMVKKSKEE